MKKLVKSFFRWMGYEVHKQGYCTDPNPLAFGNRKIFPYINRFNIMGNSFDFWIINEEIQALFNNNEIEKDEEVIGLTKLIKEGDRILEVGSQYGFFTSLMSSCVKNSGFVLGVEPLPRNYLIATSNIALNKFWEVCELKNIALSDTLTNLNLTLMSSNASITKDGKNTISVRALTGDSLLGDYGPFDLVKIDVEGYEAKVLAGCKQILKSRPKIALELHVPFLRKYHSNVEEIFKLIGIEDYEGIMIYRDEKFKSYPFSKSSIKDVVINLLLRPRT